MAVTEADLIKKTRKDRDMNKRIFKITESQYNLLKSLNEDTDSMVIKPENDLPTNTTVQQAKTKVDRMAQEKGLKGVVDQGKASLGADIKIPGGKDEEITFHNNNQSTQTEGRVITISDIRENTMRKLKENSELLTFNELLLKNK